MTTTRHEKLDPEVEQRMGEVMGLLAQMMHHLVPEEFAKNVICAKIAYGDAHYLVSIERPGGKTFTSLWMDGQDTTRKLEDKVRREVVAKWRAKAKAFEHYADKALCAHDDRLFWVHHVEPLLRKRAAYCHALADAYRDGRTIR